VRRIIALSLRLSSLVLVVSAVVLVASLVGLAHAPVDTLPEFLPPKVQVQTEALGLSAKEVEQFITVPLEDEFNGIAWTQHIQSKSLPGLSTVELTFKPGTDIYAARQLVTERVAQGPSMVNVGTPPVMIQPQSAENRVMMIGLSSKSTDPIDLSTLAYWQIRPRLLAVPGVSGVSIWGQRDQELQVRVDPKKLNAAGITLDQVLATTGDAMWTSPLTFVEASSPGADGFIDMPNQRISVQHILPIKSASDLAKVPVEETGKKRVLLGDIATVVRDHPPLRGDATLSSGQQGLILVVQKLPGTSTLAVTRGLDEAIASLKPGLRGIDVDAGLFRPATFIESALGNLGIACLIAFLLFAVSLGILTRSWRAALIGLLSMALSLASAAYILLARGTTFTTLTVAGLFMATGVVVDGTVAAIIAIMRRLRERRASDAETPVIDAVTDGGADAAQTLMWGLVIIVISTAPLLVVGGLDGLLLKPMTVAYVLALLTAAAVAVVVTPALAFVLAPREPHPPAHAAEWIERRYRRGLSAFSVWAWAAVGVLVLVGVVLASQLSLGSFIPPMRDSNLVIQWGAVPGTSLQEMNRVTSRAGAELRSIVGVKDVASHVGQALMGDQIADVDSAQTWITLAAGADRDAVLAAIRDTLDNYAGLRHTVMTYPESALAAAKTGSGKPLTVRLYGSDHDRLYAAAQEMRPLLAGLPGIVDPQVQSQKSQTAIQVEASVTAAARYRLSPGDIRRQTSVLVAGIPVGSYYQQQQIFEVTVWSESAVHDSLGAIEHLSLGTPSGGRVPLGAVASVSLKPTPHEIDHYRASPYVDITADVKGVGLQTAVAEAGKIVSAFQLPLGYYGEVLTESQQSGIDPLLAWMIAAVIIAALLVLQAAFGSWRYATLVLLLLPLTVVGCEIGAYLAHAPLSLGSLVGLVIVLGVALLGALEIVRGLRHIDAEQTRLAVAEIVADSAERAAYPIAVTAVAIVAVAVPFVALGDVAGMEIVRPAGLVVIGGVLTAVLVNIFILPALCIRFAPRGSDAPQEEPAEEELA
jgi:Cu/Ag efflux pump CusA